MREPGVFFPVLLVFLMTRKNNFGAVAGPVQLLWKEKCLGAGASADGAWGGPGAPTGGPGLRPVWGHRYLVSGFATHAVATAPPEYGGERDGKRVT